jgi:DNA replication protein DnaC
MSTDTLYQQLRGHLHYLKLVAVADALAPALEHAERERPGYSEFLTGLLQTEVDATEQRRLQGRLRFSKLPARKTLAQFDRDAQPSLDARMIDELATLRFIEERANVLLIGPPGVGKPTSPSRSATKPSKRATASSTPPPPTSSRAPTAPRSKGAGRPRCASGTARSCS